MQRRRQLMGMPHGLDTSPIIDEYGVYWNRTYGSKTTNENWCITKSYDAINAPYSDVNVQGFIGTDSTAITFQYQFSNGSSDWYYFNGVNPRRLPTGTNRKIISITFSVEQAEIDNSYAYLVETGQIFFAGKNTPYYGHTNISELE